MREELQSALGLYSPSFFKMYIGAPENIDDIFNLSVPTSAAFLHEYVHFLQDITTIYGQKNIISVVDYIKTVNDNHLKSGNRELFIPYIPQVNRDGGAFYNGELQKLHIGTLSMPYSGSVTAISVSVRPQFLGYGTENIELIHLQLSGNTVYQFGSHAVIESMAHCVEQTVYPEGLEKPDDFCYVAATEVVKFCYPELIKDPLNVIALCDATLMYYNPAAVFYWSLVKMKENSYVPVFPHHVYSFVFSHFNMRFHMMTEIDRIFNNHTSTAISQLEGYFTTDLFGANRTWMNYTLTKANEIRKSRWGFFIDLASGGALDKNVMFRHLFGALGMPLVTNQNALGFFVSPVKNEQEVRPDILWAINQIYNIYINSNTSRIRRCSMVEWCRESCKNHKVEDYTDHRCEDNPWERVSDKELCVFAQVWKTWGMENIVPMLSSGKG